MAKTRGAFGLKFSFKQETKTKKFAAMVEGSYQETTAVSQGQANNALRSRYRKANRLQDWVFVKVEPCPVRDK